MLNYLQLGGGLCLGAVVAFSLFATYDALFDDPAVKQETRQIVEAEAEGRTKDAIATVSSAAERARAMRRYCAGRGLLYDFEHNKCGID